MKAFFTTSILLVLSGAVSGQTTATQENASLLLTTRVTEHRYCEIGYSDMVQVRMSLQLTWSNTGVRPIILSKSSKFADYVLISMNVRNAEDKKYEVKEHVTWLTDGYPTLDEGDTPGGAFIVLAPLDSYLTETDIRLPIARGDNREFLKPGDYVLQIVVGTWPGTTSQIERLRNKWKATGFLWGSSVKSEPMSIEINDNPKIVSCE